MKKIFCICLAICSLFLLVQNESHAQNSTMDDVHLFQSFFRDTPITGKGYAEGLFYYANSDFFDRIKAGAQGGFAVTPEMEITTGLYYLSLDFDDVSSETGLADIPVFGRYNFINEETKLSGGAYVTVPVGSEDIGEGNLDFGVFGAVRHPVSEYVVLTGTLGVDFFETPIDDYEASLNLGAGLIYAASEEFNIVSELSIMSETDNAALSGGIDYELGRTGRLRGNLLLGLDDGAPDFGLSAGLLITL